MATPWIKSLKKCRSIVFFYLSLTVQSVLHPGQLYIATEQETNSFSLEQRCLVRSKSLLDLLVAIRHSLVQTRHPFQTIYLCFFFCKSSTSKCYLTWSHSPAPGLRDSHSLMGIYVKGKALWTRLRYWLNIYFSHPNSGPVLKAKNFKYWTSKPIGCVPRMYFTYSDCSPEHLWIIAHGLGTKTWKAGNTKTWNTKLLKPGMQEK